MTFSNTDFILSRSPYYITYSATASNFDYCLVNLTIWDGELTPAPATASFNLTVYKTKNENDYLYLDISEYVKGVLDPKFSNEWFTNDGLYKECCFVKWTLNSYKIYGGAGVLYETVDSKIRIGTLGYFFNVTNSSGVASRMSVIDDEVLDLRVPSSLILINPVNKYSTSTTHNYSTSVAPNATNTDELIVRTSVSTNNIIYSYEHREWQIAYLNRYGVWDTFLFNRVSKKTMNVTNEKYGFFQPRPDLYDVTNATNRIISSNGMEQWILNTELLDEEQNSYMQELFLSDRWFLINATTTQVFPVILTEKKYEEKLGLYERAKIAWTLKFDDANNKINDFR